MPGVQGKGTKRDISRFELTEFAGSVRARKHEEIRGGEGKRKGNAVFRSDTSRFLAGKGRGIRTREEFARNREELRGGGRKRKGNAVFRCDISRFLASTSRGIRTREEMRGNARNREVVEEKKKKHGVSRRSFEVSS